MKSKVWKPLFRDADEGCRPQNIDAVRAFIPKQSIEQFGGCLAWYAMDKQGRIFFWFKYPESLNSWQESCVSASDLIANSFEVSLQEFFAAGVRDYPTRYAP